MASVAIDNLLVNRLAVLLLPPPATSTCQLFVIQLPASFAREKLETSTSVSDIIVLKGARSVPC